MIKACDQWHEGMDTYGGGNTRACSHTRGLIAMERRRMKEERDAWKTEKKSIHDRFGKINRNNR